MAGPGLISLATIARGVWKGSGDTLIYSQRVFLTAKEIVKRQESRIEQIWPSHIIFEQLLWIIKSLISSNCNNILYKKCEKKNIFCFFEVDFKLVGNILYISIIPFFQFPP